MDFHEEEFNKKALELFNASEKLNDNWRLHEKDGKFFLSKKEIISLRSVNLETTQDLEDDEIILDVDPSVANSIAKEIVSIEYHVLFHPSYQVPCLYFNAHADGSLISLDDISRIFINEFEFQSCHNEMQNLITQAEHPILFRPFFMLHPCKVNQVLNKFPQSRNFVLTFLTIYGPSIQIKMNPDYEKLISS